MLMLTYVRYYRGTLSVHYITHDIIYEIIIERN